MPRTSQHVKNHTTKVTRDGSSNSLFLERFVTLGSGSSSSKMPAAGQKESIHHVNERVKHTLPLQAFLLSVLDLLRSIHILLVRLLFRQTLKRRHLDRQTTRSFTLETRTKRIVQSSLPREITLQVPPHQPEERPRTAPAAKRGAHDEVEEVARREKVHLGDLGCVLRQDENKVDGIRARHR